MELALIRHGSAEGNLKRAYVGRLDQPLCPEGVRELKKRLESTGYPRVSAVFTSPMLRCIQTAQLIYPDLPGCVMEELQERDFGQFEGLNHREITALPGHSRWGSAPEEMPFPGGESWDAFAARSRKGFRTAVGRMIESQMDAAAIICHGGTIMAVLEQFAEPSKSRYDWQCTPGGGFLLRYDISAKKACVILGPV